MDRETAISTASAAANQIQAALAWAEANLPDPRWASVHKLLSKAATEAEAILGTGAGSIHPDGGTDKPPV
jgi:hypothetical protein